jgi:hypothetical protein
MWRSIVVSLVGIAAVLGIGCDGIASGGVSEEDATRRRDASSGRDAGEWASTSDASSLHDDGALASDARAPSHVDGGGAVVPPADGGTERSPEGVLDVAMRDAAGEVVIAVHPADVAGAGEGTLPLRRTFAPGTRIWLSAPLRVGTSVFVRWERDGVELDAASTISLAIEESVSLTAVYETPTCSGVAVSPGTDSILAAVAAHPAGTTFCIGAGVHRFTTRVVLRTGDRVIGAPGAVLNGSRVISSFVRDGAHWVATGQTQDGPRFGEASCMPGSPACIHPERVFVDDRDLAQETSLAALGPGEFYFDYAGDRIHLFDDPTGHVVEVTTGSGGLWGTAGIDDVTIRNLVLEKFGGVCSNNCALKPGLRWVIENSEMRWNSDTGGYGGDGMVMRNNFLHHNGRYGIIGGHGTFEIAGNVIASNNIDGHNGGNDASGTKFLHTVDLVLRGNIVRDNVGSGLWTDYDNIGALFENNIVERNTMQGIDNEANCQTTIRYNLLRGNATHFAGRSLWHGAQIYNRMSYSTVVHDNEISAEGTGHNALGLRFDDGVTYDTPLCGLLDLHDITVSDNLVRLDTGDAIGYVGRGSEHGISFTRNRYLVRDEAGAYFVDNDAPIPWTAWRAAGQDEAGSLAAM